MWPRNDGELRWNIMSDWTMEHYVELDVSLKQTSICVVNQVGSVVREGIVDAGGDRCVREVKGTGIGTDRP